MTNAVFSTGPVTKLVASTIEPYRLVDLVDEGKVAHAKGTKLPYGAVAQKAAPEARRDNDISYGLPNNIAVNTHQAVVLIESSDTIPVGDKVYAAADGKVAKDGDVVVGISEGAGHSGTVRVHLFHPAGLVSQPTLSAVGKEENYG